MLRQLQTDAVPFGSPFRWASLAVLALSLFINSSLLAYNGSRIAIPGKPNAGRLQIEIEFNGIETPGYRPIQVTLVNQVDNPVRGANPRQFPGPTKRDRVIEIAILPYYNWGGNGVETRQTITIPKGSTSATAIILRPEYATNYYAAIRATENGNILPDVEGPFQAGSNNSMQSDGTPGILLISRHAPLRKNRPAFPAVVGPGMWGPPVAAALPATTGTPALTIPDFRNLLALVPDRNNSRSQVSVGPTTNDTELLNMILGHSYFNCFPPVELPQHWLALTQYAIILVPFDDLAQLEKADRTALQALGHWLRAGGSLVVYDVGPKLEKLAQLEKLLETSFSRPVTEELLAKPEMDPANGGIPVDSLTGVPSTFANEPISCRQVGLGQLVALGKDDPFPGSQDDWNKLWRVIGPGHSIWHHKHGMSLIESNHGFWNWPIPGFGAAPVISFLILSTLFAVAIGPINYWYLQRLRRNYLLLLTVPVGATVVTLLLFSYALLADGLGTRVRVRSFTQLDQKYGTAVSWSRQTYYASVAPSKGFLYGENEAIYPLEHQPINHFRGNASARFQVTWDGSEQRLDRGYIASRTFSQQMIIHADRTSSKLLVKQPVATAPPEVGNYLAGKVTSLLLRSESGEWWEGANIGREKLATLTRSEPESRRALLVALHREGTPQFPQGYNDNPRESVYGFLGLGRNYYSGNSRTNPQTNSSLLESNLARLITAPSQASLKIPSGADSSSAGKQAELLIDTFLAPGTYLALVEDPNDVPLGVASAKHRASFQIIEGNW